MLLIKASLLLYLLALLLERNSTCDWSYTGVQG